MIALGCDHGGFELKQEIKKYLEGQGIQYVDYGCDSTEAVDYPVYAKKVAKAIQSGECEKGIRSAEQESEFLLLLISLREYGRLFVLTASAQRLPGFIMTPTFLLWEEEWLEQDLPLKS